MMTGVSFLHVPHEYTKLDNEQKVSSKGGEERE